MIIGIVAVDRNGAIGKGGKLPWHYSADMKHFKETTIGHACVMGRRTWLTLKKPLKDRLNIVLSRQGEGETERRGDTETGRRGDTEMGRLGDGETDLGSVVTLRNLESVLSLTNYLRCNLFVIGGAQVYSSFLPYIDKWIVTEVPLEVEGADVFVPENYLGGFTKVQSKDLGENLLVSYHERII